MDPELVAEFLGTWGYPALLLLLLATGFGSPLPEDLLLLICGFLLSANVFEWRIALPLAFVGVVGSDLILYYIGRRVFHRALRSRWLRLVVRPGRLRYAARWFARLGDRVVFLSRLIPGTRAVVFVTAGIRRMPVYKFLLFDILGALIWVPLLLTVGGQVGEEIGGLEEVLGRVRAGAIWAILALLLLAAARWFWPERVKSAT
jgi:membrane protein DedA with SNARE-associated domain